MVNINRTLRNACTLLDEGGRTSAGSICPTISLKNCCPDPRTIASPPYRAVAGENLQELSEAAIARAIAASHGNMSEAVRRLGKGSHPQLIQNEQILRLYFLLEVAH
jgi:hypothetical protein